MRRRGQRRTRAPAGASEWFAHSGQVGRLAKHAGPALRVRQEGQLGAQGPSLPRHPLCCHADDVHIPRSRLASVQKRLRVRAAEVDCHDKWDVGARARCGQHGNAPIPVVVGEYAVNLHAVGI